MVFQSNCQTFQINMAIYYIHFILISLVKSQSLIKATIESYQELPKNQKDKHQRKKQYYQTTQKITIQQIDVMALIEIENIKSYIQKRVFSHTTSRTLDRKNILHFSGSEDLKIVNLMEKCQWFYPCISVLVIMAIKFLINIFKQTILALNTDFNLLLHNLVKITQISTIYSQQPKNIRNQHDVTYSAENILSSQKILAQFNYNKQIHLKLIFDLLQNAPFYSPINLMVRIWNRQQCKNQKKIKITGKISFLKNYQININYKK